MTTRQEPQESGTDVPLPVELLDFLPCATPAAWVEWALDNETLLLIDHAQCEKKAASTAMSLMYRYVDQYDLLICMSQLAREEILHFEQVVKIMRSRGIEYRHLSASRYADGLRQLVAAQDPQRLVDILIVGALIEARSCERFACLIPHLDDELARFYRGLVKSEGRHFEDYLRLARQIADSNIDNNDIDARIEAFRSREKDLVTQTDAAFRFHSGVPA